VDIKTVSVFGTSKAMPGEAVFAMAEELGRMLAENGFTVANGGYGGTMLAGAKGAASVGGRVIGVTCTAFKRGRANEYITEEISTSCLSERLAKLIELGDAYIVLPGGTGTLLELADVWEHKEPAPCWSWPMCGNTKTRASPMPPNRSYWSAHFGSHYWK
jgi:uncharacterized protein (TIGR00730 family)